MKKFIWLFGLMLIPFALHAEGKTERILTAELGYAEPMEFDYDKDGKPNRIQMWAVIIIDKTDKGYEGYLRRFMKDIDNDKPVLGYSDINMLPDMPYGEKLPVSQVEQTGKTVLFKAGSKSYIFFDGGEGYMNDAVIANDGVRDYIVKLYAGDIKIIR